MKAKRGLTIRWPVGRMVDYVPPDRDCIVIYKDRFGSVHATGWGPSIDLDDPKFEKLVRKALVYFNLNPIIEP